MARQSKKIRLVIWFGQEGFEVKHNFKEMVCRKGNVEIRYKRKPSPLRREEYDDIGLQLYSQGYDTTEYREQFLTPSPLKIRRQIPIGLMEVQYDLKSNGAVIRINATNGCIFKMCKVPVELVFDSQGNPKDFVDIEYPGKPEKKVGAVKASMLSFAQHCMTTLLSEEGTSGMKEIKGEDLSRIQKILDSYETKRGE